MTDFTLYAILLTAIITFFSLHYYYKGRLNNVIQSFLNSHENIMILVNLREVTMINKAGLKVFGYESLKSFKLSHADVSDFFLENDEENEETNRYTGVQYIDKYTHGRKWIEAVSKRDRNQVKVKMFSKEEMIDCYYQIRVSRLNSGNNYSLSFTDITDLESKRLNSKRKAEYDPLTKIYNRVKVNDVLKELMYNVKKYNYKLTLILFDIDHFKRVNDDYGHNAGDSVLVELSSLVKGLLRNGDIFSRWGGEEFVVLLKDTSIEDTTFLASRLRREIEKFHFDIVQNVTCSFGVTQFKSGDTETQFFERVDEALYEAKDNGRNQVVTK
jgi:diguanylate cyclase (GGDEF)-like protein